MAYVCLSRIEVDADMAEALSQRAICLLELAHDMIGVLTPDFFDDKDLIQVRLAAGVGMAVLHSWIRLLHERGESSTLVKDRLGAYRRTLQWTDIVALTRIAAAA